jgi:hypothetical protein
MHCLCIYLMKLVSDLRQFSGFHRALRFLPPITGRHDITEILRGHMSVLLLDLLSSINILQTFSKLTWDWVAFLELVNVFVVKL